MLHGFEQLMSPAIATSPTEADGAIHVFRYQSGGGLITKRKEVNQLNMPTCFY
jgi:hypothetical protein